jgi:hypothetical protein
MSEDMRQEMNGVKTRLGGVETVLGGVVTKLNVVEIKLGVIETRLGAVETKLDVVETKLGAVETKLDAVETRVAAVENTTRNIAVIVAGHAEAFVRIEKQLTKLDELDGLKKSLEVFTSEIIASRSARTLTDKSFSDHRTMLADHELRLTRIELRSRQS